MLHTEALTRRLHFPMDEYFQRLADWIDLESVAEAERLNERRKRQNGPDAEKSGETLLDLVVTDEDAGLGGRYLITLVKRNRTLQLPWNRLRVGSPVVLTPNDDSSGDACQGVVTAISRQSIQVAVNDWPEAERLRIDLSPDEITRKRMLNALKRAKGARGRTKELRDVLLGERDLSFKEEEDCHFTAELNESQQAAIRFALSASDVAIIHGPPGTGKTTTIVELICQAIAKGQKVLACAPSNTAVDNLLEKLVDARQKTVRLGHPARVSTRLQDYTLDAQVARHDLTGLIREMQREAEGLFRQAGKFTRAQPAHGAKREMRQEAKRLKADIRMLEQQAIDSIVDKADVVCATTTLDESLLGDRHFDLVVIDEACQSTEPGCWLPVLRADRLVLAGDHCQLPPTVLSKQAAKEGLEVSLLERLVGLYGDRITRRLNTQYRMHDQIMNFSSEQFYEGTLQSHDSVSGHLLSDLDYVDENFVTIEPVTFIDSAGAGWDEELEPDGLSKRNLQEAELVLRKITQLQDTGVRGRDIAVIAPYGFLSDARRMNVALTRARRKLIVIGDSATVGGNEFFAAMLEYFESIGAYHTVWEETGA